MSPRAIVICHTPHEGAGEVRRALERRGVAVDTFLVVADPLQPASHEPFPDLDRYDIVASMGAPFSVYDVDVIGSWIDRELDFLRTAHHRGIPVLGVCFGGQALAAALGGEVVKADRPEIGWYEIDSRVPWIDRGPWFQWHGDRFVAPPGADVVAESAAAPQAYVIEQSCGVQFHPEVDRATIDDWLDGRTAADEDLAEAGADPDAILAVTDQRLAHSLPAADRLVEGFLRAVAKW